MVQSESLMDKSRQCCAKVSGKYCLADVDRSNGVLCTFHANEFSNGKIVNFGVRATRQDRETLERPKPASSDRNISKIYSTVGLVSLGSAAAVLLPNEMIKMHILNVPVSSTSTGDLAFVVARYLPYLVMLILVICICTYIVFWCVYNISQLYLQRLQLQSIGLSVVFGLGRFQRKLHYWFVSFFCTDEVKNRRIENFKKTQATKHIKEKKLKKGLSDKHAAYKAKISRRKDWLNQLFFGGADASAWMGFARVGIIGAVASISLWVSWSSVERFKTSLTNMNCQKTERESNPEETWNLTHEIQKLDWRIRGLQRTCGTVTIVQGHHLGGHFSRQVSNATNLRESEQRHPVIYIGEFGAWVLLANPIDAMRHTLVQRSAVSSFKADDVPDVLEKMALRLDASIAREKRLIRFIGQRLEDRQVMEPERVVLEMSARTETALEVFIKNHADLASVIAGLQLDHTRLARVEHAVDSLPEKINALVADEGTQAPGPNGMPTEFMRSCMPTDHYVSFASGSAEISDATGFDNLIEETRNALGWPIDEEWPQTSMLVLLRGSSSDTGQSSHNLELSELRADHVKEHLLATLMDAGDIRPNVPEYRADALIGHGVRFVSYGVGEQAGMSAAHKLYPPRSVGVQFCPISQ